MKEIEKIIERYEATDWTTERTALATVVVVEESAYRRIGARMYVSSTGQWIGGISGGCLEGDALKKAKLAILNNRPSVVIYDTMEDDAHQIGVGLGCNGRIEVLFTPVDPKDDNNPIELLKKIKDRRTETILLQVIETKQSEQLGLCCTSNNRAELERRLDLDPTFLNAGIANVRDRKKSTILLTPSGERLLIEWLRPNLRLMLIGDNYDVNAFVDMAVVLGWEVHLAGKKQKISRTIFDKATQVYTYETIKQLPIDPYTAVILMSHDYRTDLELLQFYAPLSVSYIGLLGPKKRMEKMQAELLAQNSTIDLNTVSTLFAPVGLDIGAESPEEIALSIAAEIIGVFRERDGGSLRERDGPIHERE